MTTKGKPSAKLEVNSFVQGLITEASPLNFPPNASFDEENYDLNRRGTRSRRKGMDFEDSFVNRNITISDIEFLKTNPPSTYKWLAVGGDNDLNYLVVQTGNYLRFHDMKVDPLSSAIGSSLQLTFPEDVTYSFTSVDGKLIVVAGQDQVAIITRDSATGFITAIYSRLLTRDVWGVEETTEPSYETDVSYRGGGNNTHKYNLQNQSWGIPRKDKDGVLRDPTELYNTDLGVYPSNSEVVWTGLQFQPVATGQVPFERIYTNLYQETLGSELKTARGYYIIDVLRRGASRQTQYIANNAKYPILTPASVTLPGDFTPGGAAVIGEFAGRVFFGGFSGEIQNGDIRSPNLSNLLFFSQLVKSSPDIVKCYQSGDPTSRESSDVVDTDGGFIRIAGMFKPLALLNLSTSLIVIATNGVWSVTGGSDFGFSATNFKVDKISTFGGIAVSSVVEFSGRAMYWGEDGIYAIGKDQFGSWTVQSVTENTIQTYYESLGNDVKARAVSCYDAIGKKIRWLYKSGEVFTETSIQRELVFDLSLNAFSKNRIYNSLSNRFEITSLFSSIEFKNPSGDEEVLVGDDEVFIPGDDVVIPSIELVSSLQTTRYVVYTVDSGIAYYSFAYYKDETFVDWQVSGEGVDAFAFLITGAQTAGDSSLAKQVPYLTMHFYRTEDGVDENLVPVHQSSCLFRGQWDFSNSINSNKWGPLREAYRYRRLYLATDVGDTYDTGFSLITSKNKLRGRGKAFSLYLETSPLKDCRIVGWNLNIDGNAN